jgi:ankyrin repeat protein
MNRLGVFFLQGFGAAKSFQKAFSWFCLAAEHGSIEARKMVFRMERAADTLPERVEATLSDAVRAAWMVDAIVDACKGDIDERMLPEGITLNGILERVRGVLSSVDARITRHGLVRDIEHNVVRIMAYNPAQDQTRRRTREHLRETAKDSPVLSRALEYIYADMPDALDQHLMTNPVPLAFLDRLVTTAADYGHLGVLRSLCVKHGANPNYIDTPSGRKLSPLTTAAKSSDFATVTTLLDCGANAAHLLIAMPATVNHGSSPIMGLSMQLIEKQVGRDYMDGITPSMNGAFANDDTPPDNSNPPPLFYAVLFNRLDKIFSLLVRGANPNVRFEGWTAVHLAVRMLHPSALLLLLAFGADPNARNSKEGYTTPLHTLSEVRLQLPEDSPGFNLQPLDFLLRPYQRLPVDTDGVELVQRRAIIVRILLKCGANPSARCIDGFTPLMTSIVTPAPDAAALTTLMLEAGVSVEDRTSRGETVLHVCVMAIAHQRLKTLLEHGARSLVDAMDMSKCTPLILACMMQDGSPQVVKILLDHEADMTIRGPFGLTALDVALLVGNTVILDHLLARAATLPAHLLEKLLQGVDEDLRNPFHFCLSSPDLAAATDRFNRLRTLTGAADIRKLGSQRDRNGYTPYHLALFRRNIAACRILTSECGVADSLPPGGREDAAFPSIHTIRSRREEVMKAKDSRERETLIDECEYTGGSKSLTPAEIRHQSELDEAIRLHGDRSRQAIWCMDTLGTVHERYGRLRKAQDIYHSGWLKALESLGPKNRITHDLACKLLRVLRVRGVEETEVPYVANWHAVNGSNTIGAGLVIESEANLGLPGVLPGALSGNKEPGDFRQPGLSKKAVSCVRENCGKPSTMVCDGEPTHLHVQKNHTRYLRYTDPNRVQAHPLLLRGLSHTRHGRPQGTTPPRLHPR